MLNKLFSTLPLLSDVALFLESLPRLNKNNHLLRLVPASHTKKSIAVMHSTADLRCIQCHINHMTLDAPNPNNRPILPFVGRTHYMCPTESLCIPCVAQGLKASPEYLRLSHSAQRRCDAAARPTKKSPLRSRSFGDNVPFTRRAGEMKISPAGQIDSGISSNTVNFYYEATLLQSGAWDVRSFARF